MTLDLTLSLAKNRKVNADYGIVSSIQIQLTACYRMCRIGPFCSAVV